jgi:hypothetical protein
MHYCLCEKSLGLFKFVNTCESEKGVLNLVELNQSYMKTSLRECYAFIKFALNVLQVHEK